MSDVIEAQRARWRHEYGQSEADDLVCRAVRLAEEWGELDLAGAIREVDRQRTLEARGDMRTSL